MDKLPECIMDIFMESAPSPPISSSSSSSSSSDDTDVESTSSIEENAVARNHVKRITDYVSKTVSLYNNVEFQQHFRLQRRTLHLMEGIITQANVLHQWPQGQKQVSPHEGLLITIWYLANIESFRQISDRFGFSMDTVRNVIKIFLKYFISQSDNYIKWPSQEQCRISEEVLFRKSGIRGAIGAIDGSHVRIARPHNDQESFCNRKGYHSMVLQAVCDHKKRFTEVFFGEPGSQHDARILRKSNIFKRAEDGTLNIGNYFLLGDSAYPCLSWLIPPFKDDGNLTRNHRIFNYRHSSARVLIEHSFGLLKSRFRRLLHRFENQDAEFIVLCGLGACIFHNICIRENDINVEIQIEDMDEDDMQVVQGLFDGNQGQNKRNIIFNSMFARNAEN